MTTNTDAPERLWAEEPSSLEGHARIRARIAGLHCSLCTGTIEKALGRQAGVDKVAVSLTHEQALVDYDPAVIRPEQILWTLRDIGYDLYDPRKLRPFEEEEADLVREGQRLLAAVAASLAAIALILQVSGLWSLLVPASVVALMLPVSYAILRAAGRARAVVGAIAIVAPAIAAYLADGSASSDSTLRHGSAAHWPLPSCSASPRTSCGWPIRPRAAASSTSMCCSKWAHSPASSAESSA